MNITDLSDDILGLISDKVSEIPTYKYKKVILELEEIIKKTQIYIGVLFDDQTMGADCEHHIYDENNDFTLIRNYDPVEDWIHRSICRKWGWKSVNILKRWTTYDDRTYERDISYYVVDIDEFMLGSRWYDYLQYTYPKGYFKLLYNHRESQIFPIDIDTNEYGYYFYDSKYYWET